jgi:hypothetical protein
VRAIAVVAPRRLKWQAVSRAISRSTRRVVGDADADRCDWNFAGGAVVVTRGRATSVAARGTRASPFEGERDFPAVGETRGAGVAPPRLDALAAARSVVVRSDRRCRVIIIN